MSASTTLINKNAIVHNFLDKDLKVLAKYDEKLERIIDQGNALLEGEIRQFLTYLGIPDAQDVKKPATEIIRMMDLAGLKIMNMVVTEQPELNGVWIMELVPGTLSSWQPIIAFCPRMERGKIAIKRRILDQRSVNITTGGTA